MHRNTEAFTGLEAAIVLIAFVVVASVFSFTMLGAGFYTTQKTENVLHSSVASAGSTPELLGNVYGLKGTSGIGYIRFSMGLSSGGSIIDLDKMVITWSTSSVLRNYDANVPLYSATIAEGCWGITDMKPYSAAGDTFLEPNEVFTMAINLRESDELLEGERFSIEMTGPSSSTFIVSRKAPYQIDAVNVLT